MNDAHTTSPGGRGRFEAHTLQTMAILLMTIAMAVMRSTFGRFSGAALLLEIAAATCVGVSLLAPWGWARSNNSRVIVPLLLASLGVSIWQMPDMGAISNLQVAWAIILLVIALDRSARAAPYLFGLLLLSQAIVVMLFLAKSPDPRIDVYLIQALGAENLLHGIDPYAITFPDIYGPSNHFYPPGIVVNGQVQCGYFYWPMSLLLAVPGYLAGDVRYTNMVALTIAAALIGYVGRSRNSFLAASVVLFCPGVFLLLINAWIEPQMLMLLAGAMFFATRRGRWAHAGTFVLLGLLLAEKQYILLTLPLIWMLVPVAGIKPFIRAGAIVAITAATIILPFFLWNPCAFMHSSRALYVNLLRTDAISVLAWLKLRFDLQLNLALTGSIGLSAALLIAWRAPRTPAHFAAGLAFVLTLTFMFSTQAFLNYYFLSAGALILAIALPNAPANHIDSGAVPESADMHKSR